MTVAAILIGLIFMSCSGPSSNPSEPPATASATEVAHSDLATAIPNSSPTIVIQVTPVAPLASERNLPVNETPTAEATEAPIATATLGIILEVPTPTFGYVYNPDQTDPAYCALANRPPIAEPDLAATWTDFCFPSADSDPVPPLSYAYLNPPSAVRYALEQHGINPHAANPIIQNMFTATLSMVNAYHLVTAEYGYFNQDTTGFLDWITQIVGLLDVPGVSQDLIEIGEVASSQAFVAIYEPDTDIGVQIRLLENGVHPLFPGQGPEVYWDYLIKPAAAINGRHIDRERFSFNFLLLNYQDLALTDGPKPSDFGAYLVSLEYVPPGS